MDIEATVDRLCARLRSTPGRQGWGYQDGKASRIEPTCWALLALHGAGGTSSDDVSRFVRPHLAFLESLQDSNGLLIETEPGLANMAVNGLAYIVLNRFAGLVSPAVTERLASALVREKGVRLAQAEPGQDSTLQGWAWVRDTFSWVEPTAWCLLALKTGSVRSVLAAERRQEAERLLTNRMCRGGGWNYGNASALGQDLRPYTATTALGLLAMQDRPDDSVVRESLAYLSAQRLAESAAMTLSLVSVCLRLFGEAPDDVDDTLARVVETSERAGNVQGMAMAAFALTWSRHRSEAFRVGA